MLDFQQQGLEEFRGRLVYCFLALGVLFVFLLPRLIYLQVVRGDFFWVFSAEHTIKEIRIPASRGVIFDRFSIPIVENRPSFDLILVRQHVGDLEVLKRSLQSLAVPPDLVERKWEEALGLPPFYPVVLRSDIPYDQAARLRVVLSLPGESGDPLDLRGIEVRPRPRRHYPFGAVGAAVLGYLNEISEKDLESFRERDPGTYRSGDPVGVGGIERTWEEFLKGRDGTVQRIVNAAGMEVSSEEVATWLRTEPTTSGASLTLTLDLELQRFAEEAFARRAGALVALEPATGAIRALVSVPAFDPTELVANVSPELWRGLVSDRRKLFFNRAIQGTYPPGSTYKIVTALAALEAGLVEPEESLNCRGGLRFGDRFFRCWKEGGHGRVALHEALVQSCDTYFYLLGLRLGVDRLAEYAGRLGLGRLTGIRLEGERSGTIPTSEWKRRLFGTEWHSGENLSIAVGQGANTVTPLQAALLIAQVANGGRAIQPYLVQRATGLDGTILYDHEPLEPHSLGLSGRTLEIIRAALVDVVQSPRGTAHGIRSERVTLAGKTGTAQVISEEGRQRVGNKAELRDHAWFVAFAPAEDPKIAVAVLVEHGGFGATAAAPIAKAVIERYLESLGEANVTQWTKG